MFRNKILAPISAGCLALLAGVGFASTAHGADSISDSQLTGRVKGKLNVDDPEVAQRVQISARNGVVTLQGTVFNAAQVLKVVRDAESVAGVVKVANRMSFEQ